MVSKIILNILKEFDQIIEILDNDKDAKKELEKFSTDINLLKLWRDEIESEKQSIIVLGKTTTGKSEFHNLILDIEESKKPVFKVSVDVQTSVIQTLQHCSKIEDSYAIIEIKNKEEFLKLELPNNLGIIKNENSIRIPLIKTGQISFLREKVMAHFNRDHPFQVSKAINSINIHLPLKYFKEFVFVDTPGFGANNSDKTDIVVEKIIQGKSHIIWLLSAEERNLRDSISLLKEKKELLNDNFNRINFIGNMFDIFPLQDIEEPNNTYEAIKLELNKTLNEGLVNILGITDINANLIFTSFKEPHIKFAKSTTIDELNNLEEKFQLEKKKINLSNIESFVDTLKVVLNHLENEIVGVKKEEIIKKIKRIKGEIFVIIQDISKFKGLSTVDKRIFLSIEGIHNLRKLKTIDTHDKYETYIENLKKELNEISDKLGNLIRAKLKDFIPKDSATFNSINALKYSDELILIENETFIKRVFYDKELKSNKKKIIPFLDKKIKDLEGIKISIDNIIIDILILKQRELIDKKELIDNFLVEIENIEANLRSIYTIKAKIKNIHNFLIEDTETKIAEWLSIGSKNGTINILENFLELNYLLDEHNILLERNNGK